jgi:amidase
VTAYDGQLLKSRRRFDLASCQCETVIREHVARIEEANPKLNAVVQLCLERAMKEARFADEALSRGEPKGPLHSVPITIKDNLDTAGMISTGGTEGRKGFVPKHEQRQWLDCVESARFYSGKPTRPS